MSNNQTTRPTIRVAHGASFMDLEIVAKGTHDDVVRFAGKTMSLTDLFASGWVVIGRQGAINNVAV